MPEAGAAEPNPSTEAAARDPYAPLRLANFRYFALGWVFSVIGDQVTEVAVGWDLYLRTGSAMSLGWVGLVSAAPVILLALPAGHLADRFDRRRIIQLSLVLRAACVLALAVLSYRHGSISGMYLALLLAAVGKAIGWPARSAMLPSLVPPEIFPNAVNWNSMAFQTSAMVGPAIGGIIVHWSVTSAYLVSVALTLLFAISLIPLRPKPQEAPKKGATLMDVVAGVRFVRHTKIILATITLDLFAVLLGGATYLLPVFAQDILHVGAVGFGWLRASPALGALTMGLIIAHVPPMKRAGRTLLWAVAGFGVATIVFGLSKNYWLSLAMLFLTGAFDNISVIVRHTLVQVLTPDEMRGRVSAVNNIFIGASNELGGFESGLTARLFGTITSVVAGGIGTILVVSGAALIWPQMLKLGSLLELKPPTPQELATVPEVAEPDEHP